MLHFWACRFLLNHHSRFALPFVQIASPTIPMSSSEADAKDVNNSSSLVATKPNLLKGMKIRDEFICPITYELMREPFIATDGHTYEKSAIEKWLKNNNTSPRSGEPLESTIIIPNINLKKLIQDIINEVRLSYFFLKDRIF